MSLTAIASSGGTSHFLGQGLKKGSLRKHRCWQFHVSGIKKNGCGRRDEAEILPHFRARYTSVKRLSIGESDNSTAAAATAVSKKSQSESQCVVVEFTGPQPSQGPGALLCTLLSGASVEAQPVQLERGRKRKNRPSACDAGGFGARTTGAKKTTPQATRERGRLNGDLKEEDTVDVAVRGEGRVGLSLHACTDGRKGGSSFSLGAALGGLKVDVPEVKSVADDAEAVEPAVVSPAGVPLDEFLPPLTRFAAEILDVEIGSDDADEKTEPCSVDSLLASPPPPSRKGQRPTLDGSYVEHLSSSVGMLSIVDSDSEDSDPETNLCPLVDRSGWVSDDFGSALSPLNVQPHNWSMDSTDFDDDVFAGVETFGTSAPDNIDSLLLSAEGGIPASQIDDAEASGEGKPEETSIADANVFRDVPLFTSGFSVDLLQKECDFKGRSEPAAHSVNDRSLIGVSSSNLCQMVFTGLESAGHNLGMLTATAHFWINPAYTRGQIATPIQVGLDGKVQASVRYPSMQELWPEVYLAKNIRVVEVDAMVEIRSKNGDFEYVGPKQTITYRRPESPAEKSLRYPDSTCRRISYASPPTNELEREDTEATTIRDGD